MELLPPWFGADTCISKVEKIQGKTHVYMISTEICQRATVFKCARVSLSPVARPISVSTMTTIKRYNKLTRGRFELYGGLA